MQVVSELLRVDVVAAAAGGQLFVQLLDDELATVIVEPGAAPRAINDCFAIGNAEPQSLHSIGNDQVTAKWTLALPNGAPHDLEHAQVTLNASDVSRIIAAHPGARNEIPEHRQLDARFAE